MNSIRDNNTFVPEGCVLNFKIFQNSIDEGLDMYVADKIVDTMIGSSDQWGVGQFSWKFVLTELE